jgi:hypothetical protein
VVDNGEESYWEKVEEKNEVKIEEIDISEVIE